MVPAPNANAENFSAMDMNIKKEAIVISGISGTFPNSLNIKDFADILYNKIDPVENSKPRWKFNDLELPKFHGKIPNADRFDAQFFKVSSHLAKCMDPMARKLLEHSYRAIYDAGLSIDHVAGKNIGVYMGATIAETEKCGVYDLDVTAHTMPGCSKAMFANRISYFLDVKGPSMTVDNACSTSLIALEQACLAIQRGDCEAAIVGGAHIGIHPQTVLHYSRIIPFSKDCKVKSFDDAADGCVKSDAISVVFLQKAESALRVYAEIVYVRSEYIKPIDDKILMMRNPDALADFLQRFYDAINMSPNKVKYLEAFGTGISEVDKSELEAIQKVFCGDRSDALLVGSVMSNIGYTEAASGLSSIAKVLLGYKKRLIAANLHCTNPRKDIKALQDGRMRIVTDHEPFSGSYAAVNSLSFSGINAHILLRGYHKPKVVTPKPSIPYLITIAGRNESSVEKIIDDLKSRPVDREEVALIHNIHKGKNAGNLSRGFVILDSDPENKTLCLNESVTFYDDVKRPLWFVYSGMGSQWATMGAHLMKIPIFAAAIERCHKVLAPKGLDLVHILTANDKTIYDNILNSFVGIAAVQIGLTDILREMGIVPDNVIGHSTGELGCAYADGCFTAEETILAAYGRGLVSVQTEFIRGSMAAVGIGYQQVVKLCPPEIEVACHNGPESCTLSGPADVMSEFVGKLTAQGIFAKEVPCSNIAYHSRYIAKAGPKLLEYLGNVVKTPKRRSERWLSTSIPQERWGEENAQYCSAWYHTNNLLSPVLFEETSRLVPAGAVLVEVAPHGLLQAIVKRSLHPDCRHIPLTKRGHADNSLHLLEAVGKLFIQGYNPKVDALYPKVEFPVSTETPGLSHLVEFNDSDRWFLPLTKPLVKEQTCICKYIISVHDDESNYLQGNVIRGQTLYPYSAALVLVWDSFASSLGFKPKEPSVQFRDVHLYTQPILLDKKFLKLKVTIHQGTGEFEVVDGILAVATGFVNVLTAEDGRIEQLWKSQETTTMSFDSDGIYNLFQERDYSYSGEFRSIYKCNDSFTEAQLIWKDNWVTAIDGVMQLSALQRGHSNVSRPSHIHKLTISLKDHDKIIKVDDKTVFNSYVSPVLDCGRCGGILVEKIRYEDLSPICTNDLKLLKNTAPIKDGAEKYVVCDEKIATVKDITLRSENIGDLNSLNWVESPKSESLSGTTVTVRYAGLNVLDAKVATGVISPKTEGYGMDYSGTTATGERVMGIVRGGAASSSVRSLAGLTWPVPAHWTLEDAATVPLAYAQAFYCLGIKVPLHPGMTILVQGAAGALGQAVISIALAHQCKVLTTVSDAGKKDFLLKMYPDLSEEVVGSSRDHTFADLVLLATNGRGCDIVFCCTTGDLKNATLKCASFCGITIDTVQAHCKDSYNYGMHYLTNQRSYVIVDFYNIFDNKENIKVLERMMSEGIARGYVRPLARAALPAQHAARALRLLAAARHRGRVLLRMQDSLVEVQPRSVSMVQVLERMMSEGIARGYVRPLARAALPAQHAARALRLLAAARHRGRVLLRMQDSLVEVQPRSVSMVQVLERMMSEGIARGYVRPLARAALPAQHAARALRLLAAARHRGRVLLRMQDSLVEVQPRSVSMVQVLERMMSEGIARGYVRPLARAALPAQHAARALRLLAAARHRARVLLRMQDSLVEVQPRSVSMVQVLERMMSEGIARGYVRPLARAALPAQHAARALRLLAAARHRGRVLLRMQDSLVEVQPRSVSMVQVLERMMSEGIARGYVRPLARAALPAQHAARALRLLAAARHRARVLLRMQDSLVEVQPRSVSMVQVLERMMSEGIARGYVRPLARAALPAQHAARALRLLAAARHRARVLLRMQDSLVEVQPSFTCSSESYQLVISSGDYFSIQFVDRLIKCGARNIILHPCPQTQWFNYKEKSWKKLGAKIENVKEDIHTTKSFNELLRVKNIEGIFFIPSKNNQNNSVLFNLDEASRNYPTVKHFTIISTSKNSEFEKLCATRAEKNLPGSIVYLLPDKNSTSSAVSQRNLMDVVERALFSSHRVLKIQLQQTNKKSLLKKIADIADIKLPVNIKESTTLKQMGLNSSYSPTICAFLQHSFNISLEVEKIPSLSVKLLKQIEEKIYEPDYKEKDGITGLFTTVNSDELVAVTGIMTLPTLVKHPTVSDGMIDLSKQYLWIVSGIEGQYERFRDLCERLKIPALVLQQGVDFHNESIQEIAQRYIKALTERTSLNKFNTFYILGYESGTFVALEMAAILEAKGMTGTVFCVGGTPGQVLSAVKHKLKDLDSDEALQNATIKQIASILCDNNSIVNEVEVCFNAGLTWNKKVKKAAQILGHHVAYSVSFMEAYFEAAYDRVKQILKQKPQSYDLKSQVLLFKTTSVTPVGNKEVLSQRPVVEYELGVPLEYGAQNPRVASVVNAHLSADVIEIYETQNHCELLQDNNIFESKFATLKAEEE